MSGASKISILLWANRRPRKEAEAISSGRTESKGWQDLLALGYVRISEAGMIVVTAAGGDYLAEETFYS